MIEKLTNLYFILRENAYSNHANEIKKIINFIEKNDYVSLKKTFRSRIIWGGAGSLIDIDFRDAKMNKLKSEVLRDLKAYMKALDNSPWWKFWY